MRSFRRLHREATTSATGAQSEKMLVPGEEPGYMENLGEHPHSREKQIKPGNQQCLVAMT
jgi:hypothetical protein